MTDRYREHPMVTCHLVDGLLAPVPVAEDSDETVWFALPAEPGGSRVWEGLRAHRGGRGETAQIRAVPLFAYDLNFGDQVTVVASAEGPLVATAVVADRGNYTFRVCREDADEVALAEVAMELAHMGCLIEGYSDRLLGLSCDQKNAQRVADALYAGESAGRFIYENGRQRTH